jgi:hypothetical protein
MTILQSTLHYRRRKEEGDHHYCTHILKDGSPCPYSTPYSSALPQHVRYNHTDEKPFVCPECKHAYCQKNNMDKHRQRRHNVPLPSTRATRYQQATSRPDKYKPVWFLRVTNKRPSVRSNLIERLRRYKSLAGLHDMKVSNLDYLSSDAKSGYLVYGWIILNMDTNKVIKNVTNKRSRAHVSVIAEFMNKINTLKKIYSNDKNERINSLLYLKKDYKKSADKFMEAITLINNKRLVVRT